MLNGTIMGSIAFYYERAIAGCGVNRSLCLDLEGSVSHPGAHSDSSSLHGGAAPPSPPPALHPLLSLHPSIKMSVWTLHELIDDWHITAVNNSRPAKQLKIYICARVGRDQSFVA